MKNKILLIIYIALVLTYVFPADILFAQTITNITTSDSLITDIDVGPDNFTITVTFNEAVDTTEVTNINFDPVISSTLIDSTPSWASDSISFYMNYDVEDSNVEVDSIDIYVQYALTISDTLLDAFRIDTMNPTDTVFISNFSDPIDTGGHLNIEFYKNGTIGPGYFRLYYTEGNTTWPGDSLATIKDSITSPYDLSTTDTTNYLVRIYWLDDVGNHSPNFAPAGPMQSIDNSNVYVGTLNTYEFGTITNPYDTIQEGIDNVLNGGTVNVENRTYSDSVIVNKPIYIKGIASSVYYIDGDVTLDAKPITITDAVIQSPHSWYITQNASIQDGIDAAGHGDSIKVGTGTYTENIVINKTINITSVNGSDSTYIQAAITRDHVITITADSVMFNGFSLYGAANPPHDDKAGIYLYDVENCNIKNNSSGCDYSKANDYGILIVNSDNNNFENNEFNFNIGIGLYLINSYYNYIFENNINYNIYNGSYIESSNFNVVNNNNFNNNGFLGIIFFESNNNFVINNSIKGSQLFGVKLRSCSNNYLNNNVFKENSEGSGLIIEYNSIHNVVNNNICELNKYGLQIKQSSYFNTITNNIISNNTEHGIVLDNSDNNTLTMNLSDSNTTFGINIVSSDSNNIYLNTFRDNSFPVNSNSSINDWNSPTEISYKFNGYSYHKKFLGNFYSNYSGFDSNEDGIGDSPYDLPGSEPNDNYPLILSAENYIMQAWWLYADSIMYKNFMGKPLEDVTIPGVSSYIWVSDQPINKNLSFSAIDTWTGQILFKTPPLSGNTFDIKIGYSTSGDDFVFCGPDTTIVGDGSTKLFTYNTDGNSYTIPAGYYYALNITNNAGINYDIVAGGGASYISGPHYNPELYLNPSDSLNFGKVDTTSITDSTLTIIAKNIGNAELIIDSLLGLESPFSVNFPTPDTIQVGDSTFIPVTLEREFIAGTYTDTLDIKDNCNNMSIIVTAQLTELTEPIISVIPDTVDFGIQAISDEEDSLSFVIKNLGTGNLIINNFSGLSAPFSINYPLPDTIYPDINDSSEIFITFDRSAPGYFIDTLWIHNNDVDTSIVVIGELTEPIISITPEAIDFGIMSATDQFDSLSFVIKNSGTGDLVIDGLTGLTAPFSVNYPVPDTIQPSDSSEIFIILDMSIPGSHIDTLLISNNDKDTSLVITAVLTTPIIYLNPDSINFGSMSISDEYDSLSFVVKNIGTEDLTVGSIAGLSPPFSIIYSIPDTIQPQDSSLVFIKLDKSVAGSYCDTLFIYNNDQDTSLVVTAEITAPIISLTPKDTLNFGAMDTTSLMDSTKIIWVKNIGTADLIIDSLWGLSAPFNFYYNYPDTLLPGDSIDIEVTLERNYTPGLYSDTLYIENNDIDTSIVISGELTEPIISVIPDTVDFGTQAISDEEDSLSFVIKNLGTGNLIINNFSGLSAPFSINYPLPDTIYPDINDSSEIFITFDRSAPGYFIDTLWIHNNDVDTSIVVIGELTEPIISITPEAIDFGIMSATDQFDSLSFVIKNSGTGDLVIDGLTGLTAPFSVNYPVPDTIQPSDSSEIFIILDMSIPGSHIDTLLISNNDKDTSLVITAVLTTPIIYLNPDSINFGSMSISDEYDSLSFVVKNIGTEDLTVGSIAGLSPPFSIIYSIPDTIQPQDSSLVFIKLDKSVAGSYCDTLWIYNNANDTTLVIIANITEPPEPIINYITDVPYDQGRYVIVTWQRSCFDELGSNQPIVGYNLWEMYPFALEKQSFITYDIYKAIYNPQIYFQRDDTIWVHIDYIAAMQWDEYSALAETFVDSSSVGNYMSYFFVSAHTIVPSVYYCSAVDSGYSIDNIPPNSVEEINIVVNANNVDISWTEVTEGTYQGNSYPELNGVWYKVYAGDTPDFVCDEFHLIKTVTDLDYDYLLSGEEKMFFKVIASDQP